MNYIMSLIGLSLISPYPRIEWDRKTPALCVWGFLFGSFLFLPIPISFAENGKGEMAATIIDPTTMDINEALEWCEENPESVKCEELLDRIKTDRGSEEYKTLNIIYE